MKLHFSPLYTFKKHSVLHFGVIIFSKMKNSNQMSQKTLAFQAITVIPLLRGINFQCNIGIFVMLNTKKYFSAPRSKSTDPLSLGEASAFPFGL